MTKKLLTFISVDEFKKVLAKEKDKKFKLAYALAFGSGLRISEVVGYKSKTGSTIIKPLEQDQVDLEGHKIKVYGKGGKERITVTSPMLNENNIKMLPLQINRRTLQYRFSKLAWRTIHKHLSFHDLRHAFANFMANERRVPLPMVQAMLGHTRLDTTGIYTRSNPVQTIKTAWEAF